MKAPSIHLRTCALCSVLVELPCSDYLDGMIDNFCDTYDNKTAADAEGHILSVEGKPVGVGLRITDEGSEPVILYET